MNNPKPIMPQPELERALNAILAPREPLTGQLVTPLTVLQAALRFNGDVIVTAPRPVRHGDLERMHMKAAEVRHAVPMESGFILSDGTYADRETAFKIAKAAGQITHRREGPQYYQGPELFTEDLW